MSETPPIPKTAFEQLKQTVADLSRPLAIYGLVTAIFLALALGRDAAVIGVLVAGLGTLYGAKAAENVGVAKANGGTS